VVSDFFDWTGDLHPATPWQRTVIYELHVKGFTKLHPEIPDDLRGTYAALAHPAAIRHLRELGITAVELLPIHEFPDDGFLEDRLLRNYWGYGTLGFFAPKQKYASRSNPGAQVNEFKAMVKALHAAGIEVILDVVYNHTCEGGHLGPTLSLRGIDNATYYWLMPEPRCYLDFTGTGNSINASNSEAARLIVDSLRYWVTQMHVDGFRLTCSDHARQDRTKGVRSHGAFFQIISLGPGPLAYQAHRRALGSRPRRLQVCDFPPPWREVEQPLSRRDAPLLEGRAPFGLGSATVWRDRPVSIKANARRRRPSTSSPRTTASTLRDHPSLALKTYNEANGEDNRDGPDDNHSWNHGAEEGTDDQSIIALRERPKEPSFVALLFARVPMLLAGDEMGRTQAGNNNAYCQDNEISWLEWRLDDRKKALLEFTRRLATLRQKLAVLQRHRFFAGDFVWDSSAKDLVWLRPDGQEMSAGDWQRPWISTLAFAMGGDALPMLDERGARMVGDGLIVLMNASEDAVRFELPGGAEWLLECDTNDPARAAGARCAGDYVVAGRSVVALRQPLTAEAQRSMPPSERRALSADAPTSVDRALHSRKRRAGVLLPLFSMRRRGNWGIGDVTDVARFAAWAHRAGFSVLQLLPINAVSGLDASPYAAISAYAIDPVTFRSTVRRHKARRRRTISPAADRGLGGSSRVRCGPRRRHPGSSILAFDRFLRDEWRSRSRVPRLAGFKEGSVRLDHCALRRAPRPTAQIVARLAARSARSHPDAIAEVRRSLKGHCCKRGAWQLDRQWRAAWQRRSGRFDGDLPFGGHWTQPMWANRSIFFARSARRRSPTTVPERAGLGNARLMAGAGDPTSPAAGARRAGSPPLPRRHVVRVLPHVLSLLRRTTAGFRRTKEPGWLSETVMRLMCPSAKWSPRIWAACRLFCDLRWRSSACPGTTYFVGRKTATRTAIPPPGRLVPSPPTPPTIPRRRRSGTTRFRSNGGASSFACPAWRTSIRSVASTMGCAMRCYG
jgi:glycogen operon protein